MKACDISILNFFFENAEYFEYQSLIPGMGNYVSLELTNEKW